MIVHPSLDEHNARRRVAEAVDALPRCAPRAYEGRGITMCAGGRQYLINAWVAIRMLRRSGCTLPVELWHLGPHEMRPWQRALFQPLGVTTVDAQDVRRMFPARRLGGWELKAYAALYTGFREVLALDADNVTLHDPSFLFDHPEYRRTGAIFWPDFGDLAPTDRIWELAGVPFRQEPAFESGQLLVDKGRAWQPLMLAMWLNEHSEFWYEHIYGDKDTFHIAWRRMEFEYAMPSRRWKPLEGGTMCQHDFDGRRLFQHRHAPKWNLDFNPRVPGFDREDECLACLDELMPWRRLFHGVPSSEPVLESLLVGRTFRYERVGFDERTLTLALAGRVSRGGDRMERSWTVLPVGGDVELRLYGDDGHTATMRPADAGLAEWEGNWHVHEAMRVRLTLQANGAGGEVR